MCKRARVRLARGVALTAGKCVYLQHLLKVCWQYSALHDDKLPQQRTHGDVQPLVVHRVVCVVEQQRVPEDVIVQHVLLHPEHVVCAGEDTREAAVQHLHAERVVHADSERKFVDQCVQNDARETDRRNGLQRAEHANLEV